MKIINSTSFTLILKKLLISLGIILFMRIGSFLPVPGINPIDLALYSEQNPLIKNLTNTFSNKDSFVITIFTLGIFPYINASIVLQIFMSFSPFLSKLKKEGDLSSRRLIIRLTRYIALISAVLQSLSLSLYLKPSFVNLNFGLLFQLVIWLTTGAMIILWLSEIITEYGLGNGPSIIIYTNIAGNFPNLCRNFLNLISEHMNLISVFTLSSLTILSLFGIILLNEGIRKIRLLSSKELNLVENQLSNLKKTYIPLKLNQAGVMPIILTTTVLILPTYISNLSFISKSNLGIVYYLLYGSSYFICIIFFNTFYSTLALNPKNISEQLQKMSVTIPGIRPGVQTNFYLKRMMSRLNIIGGCLLATIATLPTLIETILNVSNLNGLNTTSLIIMAGVLVDISKEINDIRYSNVYKK